MRTIRRLSILAFILAIALFGCAKHQPDLSPAGKAAYTSIQVVKALDVLRDVAIEAEAATPKRLSTAHTRTVVTYHESAVKTIGAVPGGWKPVVSQGLDQLQAQLGTEYAQLAPYVALVRTLIAGVS